MRSLHLAFVFTIAGIHALHAQVRSRPLPVGFLRADGIVTVTFVVTDSAIRRIEGNETFLPDGLASRWRILPSDAPPFDVRAGAMVHVFYDVESGKLPLVGQVTDGPRAGDFYYNGDRHAALALGRSVPAAAFQRDSSPSPARDSALARFRAAFVDTSARRALATFFHKVGPLPPSTPIRELSVWRAPIPDAADTLYVVHGERWYDEGTTTIFDLWAVRNQGRLRIVRVHGPETSDPDYKGSPFEEPWGVLRFGSRTMVVFERQLYLGRVPVVAELLADGDVRVVPP